MNRNWIGICLLLATSALAHGQFSIDIEAPPISYSETSHNNRISRLIEAIEAGDVSLSYDSERGYLESLLKSLEIPVTSQVLVFSKTSLQVRYISRRNPRAIYFNDDTYVGWVRGSSLVEISCVDPKLGAVFYSFDMKPNKPKITRTNYDCLACHATTLTQGIPGHTVRSVTALHDGSVEVQKPSFITTHRSPFEERWGGWYVTGKHGQMQHRGNAFVRGDQLETEGNGNRLSLRNEFDSFQWLWPYSDIVALMVLEHQTQIQNTLTRANFTVRKLLHDVSNREEPEELGEDNEREFNAKLASLAKEIVDDLLFCGETKLTDPIQGSVVFSRDFQGSSPKDSKGRSLRDFDLKTRLMKYPLSYQINSQAFDSLTDSLKEEVFKQLASVLFGVHQSDEYPHLDGETRNAILEILRETSPKKYAALNGQRNS